MKKSRLFFFIAFGLYHLAAFLFTYYVDAEKEDIGLLTTMHESVHLFKYATFMGLLLVIVDFIWSWQTVWRLRKKQETTQAELNKVKAKLYDLQEESDEKASEEPPADTGDDINLNTE